MKTSSIIKFFISVAIVIGLAYIFVINSNKIETREEQNTRQTKVVRQDLTIKVTIAGNVYPERKTIFTAPFNGYVKKIYVRVGQMVKKGDPIVSITQSLQSTDPIYPLRAPFAGKVVSIDKQEGEFVAQDSASDFILRIDSLANLYINSNVPEIDMVKIKVGQEALIGISAILDEKFKGVVENVSLASKQQEGWHQESKVLYPTKIKILKPYNDIKPGMSAIIDIVTSKKEKVLVLPHEYILKENDKYFIFPQGEAKREIEIGIQNESFFEIVSGVNEGDLVNQVNFLDLLQE